MKYPRRNPKTLFSLIGLLAAASAHAQIVEPENDNSSGQELIVGKIDGHPILSGTRSVSTQDLANIIVKELSEQGVNPMNPGSGTYALKMGGSVNRLLVHIDAEQGRIRWEPRTELLQFTPANFPAKVLAYMMSQGKLRQLSIPSPREFAAVLKSELSARGVNPVIPQQKEICVKLGYQNCRLLLNFKEPGLLEWSFTGGPVFHGMLADAMLRNLQSQGFLKAADGKTNLIIYQGQSRRQGRDDERSASVIVTPTETEQVTKPESTTEIPADRHAETEEASRPSTTIASTTDPVSTEESLTADESSILGDLGDFHGQGDGSGEGEGAGVGSGGNGNGSGGNGTGRGGRGKGRAVLDMINQVAETGKCPISFDNIAALKELALKKLDRREQTKVKVDRFVGKPLFLCGYNPDVDQWKDVPVRFESSNIFVSNIPTDNTRNRRHTAGADDGYWFQGRFEKDDIGDSSYRRGPGVKRNPDYIMFRLNDRVLLVAASVHGKVGFVGVIGIRK